MLPEHREVVPVGHNGSGRGAVDLEPLGALPPLGEGHVGAHPGSVPAPADRAVRVVGFDEDLGRVEEVGVDGGEVEERDA